MKKLTNIILVFMLFVTTLATAQYGIGTTSPSPSAVLDISSSSKGLLMPRMTTAERNLIASPAPGLMVYVTDSNKPNFFNGISWIELTGVIVGGVTQPGAPTDIVVTPGNTQANVAFTAPTNNGGSTITNYIVTANPGAITTSGTSSPIIVTGLVNGTAYTFSVVAVNVVGNSGSSTSSNSVTPFSVPDSPTNAVASYTAGTTEASVAFNTPTNNGGATITGYTVTSNPGGITATGATSPLVVTGLSMNETYTFTVVANNGLASAASAASNSITTIPVVPSAPLNLVASSSASGSASVTFDVPTNNGGAAITNYIITSIPAGGTGSGSSSPIAVSGLTNGTSYTFTLVAQNSAGNSIASSASNAVMPVGAPDAPTNAVASYTAGTTEASIAFNAPANNGGAAINGYTVTSNPGGLTATGATSPLVVTGLSMNETYTFTVVANNGSASAQSVASNSITTIPVAPSAPLNLVASSSASGSASVAFDVPTNNGGAAITNYIITSIPAGGTGSGSSSPIAVSGLTNGTSYTFTLVAQNSAGNSIASSASNAVMPVGAPDAPTNAVASYTAGTTEASIAFNAPANNGGAAINGYTVTSNPGGLTATGASSPLVVTGLSMNETYTFTVVANNGSASAQSVASNSITTIPVAPSAPLNLVASSSASGSASVAFDIPTNNGGAAITNYIITSIPAGGSGSGSSSPIAVSGLTNGTSYTFTLVATNSAGNSPDSVASNAVTPVTVPNSPTNVIATPDNALASIAFTVPTNTGGSAITGFTVTSSPGGLTASGSASPIVVTGLTNGTAYTFTVVATNAVGNSTASAPSSAVTPVTIPTSPTNVIATTITSTSASVFFTAPSNDGGTPVTQYTVTSSPAGFSVNGNASPITVSGLNNSTNYTFTVVATNSVGTSLPSNVSNDTFRVLDNLAANPSAAFSLRRIDKDYFGAAIQVRRSSDNTTQDIGFNSAGDLDTAALTTFCGTDSCFISIWYDQSSNARNATMATAANQLRIVNAGVIETQNGRPAITSIDGTGYLTFNQNIASGEVRTVSSVFKIRTLKLNNELFGADGSKMVDFGSQISGGTDINGNRIWFRNGSTNTYSTVGTWSYDLTSTIPQIGTFKWASSRLKAWRNSTEIVTTPTASFNWSATSINIMRGNAGLIRGLSGTIQEFIWYASDISDIDRAIIENNQSVYFQANSTPSGPISAVANFSDSIINLSWQEPSSIGMSAITDYIIEYKLSSSITWLTYNDGISTIKNATINGLTNGISYDFRVSAVNDQGIGTASTIVTGVPVKLISINDTNIYFSPYNWAPIGTEKRQAVSSGAYIKVAFTGNTIGLKLDNSNSFDGLDFNLVTAYIDGSSVPVSKLLSASNPNGFLLISNSLSEGNHYAVIYFSRQDYEPGTNRWDFNSPGVTIAAVVRVESLLVSGGSLPLVGTPIQTSNKKGLSFGDSITEGIGVGSGANRSSSLDPRSEFAYSAVMNKFIGKEYGQIGYGSQAWLSQGGGFVPTWAGSGNSWRYYSQGLERINSTTNLALGFKEGAPDYITMNLGFNDSNRSTTIPVATSKQFFVDMRQVSSAETELFMILPFAMSGSTFSTQNQFTTNKNNLIAGYNQYKLENPNDTRVHLIDLGTWGGQIVSNNSSDNIHPNKTGSNYLGTALGQIISPYLNGNFTASSTSINMVSNVTITLTGTNMLWAGTVVSGSTTNPSLSPTTFQLINSGSNASIVSQSIGSNNQATIVINPGNTSGTITIFDPNSNAKITIEVI